jgi:hypothetical protein
VNGSVLYLFLGFLVDFLPGSWDRGWVLASLLGRAGGPWELEPLVYLPSVPKEKEPMCPFELYWAPGLGWGEWCGLQLGLSL